MIQYRTKHHDIVYSTNVISIEPDLCLFREGRSPSEVVFVDQLNKSLRRRGLLYLQPSVLAENFLFESHLRRRGMLHLQFSDLAENFLFESHLSCSVDHGIGDDPGLSKCCSKGESGEDVPGGGELVLAGGGEVVGGCGDSGGGGVEVVVADGGEVVWRCGDGDSGGGERLWGDGQHEAT